MSDWADSIQITVNESSSLYVDHAKKTLSMYSINDFSVILSFSITNPFFSIITTSSSLSTSQQTIAPVQISTKSLLLFSLINSLILLSLSQYEAFVMPLWVIAFMRLLCLAFISTIKLFGSCHFHTLKLVTLSFCLSLTIGE